MCRGRFFSRKATVKSLVDRNELRSSSIHSIVTDLSGNCSAISCFRSDTAYKPKRPQHNTQYKVIGWAKDHVNNHIQHSFLCTPGYPYFKVYKILEQNCPTPKQASILDSLRCSRTQKWPSVAELLDPFLLLKQVNKLCI